MPPFGQLITFASYSYNGATVAEEVALAHHRACRPDVTVLLWSHGPSTGTSRSLASLVQVVEHASIIYYAYNYQIILHIKLS